MGIRTLALGVFAGAAISTPALAGIDFPPPWDGTGIVGNSTHWRWDFYPPGPTSQDPLIPVGSGNGTPQIIPSTSWIWQPSSPFGGDGVICIPPGGIVQIIVPNFPQPNDFKYIWIQYHWFGTGAEPATSAVAGGGFTATPYGPTVTPSPGPGGGLVGAHGWQFPFNPPEELITIRNPDPNNPMYIEWLTINTICAPTPGAAAVMGLGGLLAARRRR